VIPAALTPFGKLDTLSFLRPVEVGAYALPAVVTDTVCLGVPVDCTVGTHAAIIARPGAVCLTDQQSGAELMGWTGRMVQVTRSCGCNAMRGLVQRHLLPFPPPPVRVPAALAAVCSLGPTLRGYAAVRLGAGYQGWLPKWPVSKRHQFDESLRVEPTLYGRTKIMVKRELYYADAKVRIIQMYRNLATQAALGPDCYALQLAVSTLFDSYELFPGVRVTIATGMNAMDLGEWMTDSVRRGSRWFYERDGAKWDSTMSYTHSDWKLKMYDAMLPDFADRMAQCVDVRGFGVFREGLLSYRVGATVKSGHNDTSLGNSLINALISVEALLANGLAGDVIVCGDDSLIALPQRPDVAALMAVERECGIVPEARLFDHPSNCTFLSGRWYPNGDSFVFGPLLGRQIAKLWWTVNPPSWRQREAYLRSVALGLWGVCHGIPVLRQFLTGWGLSSSLAPKRSVYAGVTIDWQQDLHGFVSWRYGISVDELVQLEQWLDGLPRQPLFLVHPVLDRIMSVDLASIHDRYVA